MPPTNTIKNEMREKSLGYVLTALGLVAGLAWNDAISSIIGIVFPLEKDGVWAQLVYAVVITIFVIIVATYLTNYFARKS